MPKAFLLVLALTLATLGVSFAQGKPDKNLSEILVALSSPAGGRTMSYSNLNIINDLPDGTIREFLEKSLANPTGRVEVLKNLRLINCDINDGLYLDSIKFKAVVIQNSNISRIEIENSDIAVLNLVGNTSSGIAILDSQIGTLKIDANELDFNLNLSGLFVQKDLIVTDNVAGKILLEGLNTFKNVNVGDNQVKTVEIFNSNFTLPKEGFFKNYQFNQSAAFDLIMVKNVFKGDSASSVELRSNYTNLEIEDNQLLTDFYLLKSKVEERFIMVNNTFDGRVSFENFIFSETKNELYWNQFSGYKLAYSKNGQLFEALTDEGLTDEVKFKNLIATYKELHRVFLGRGDLESANACYNEMKELQGKRLRHIYLKERGFNNFFRWMLNRLLKVYTNHGTDPALAVVISFYVTMLFAIFYFFFPSEWDKESKFKLIQDYRRQRSSEKVHKLKPLLTLLGIVGLSLLNAITLSLNSFVTLGFGTIPTEGVARYLCIVEGFLGWFLLSIFTVALINQVLA